MIQRTTCLRFPRLVLSKPVDPDTGATSLLGSKNSYKDKHCFDNEILKINCSPGNLLQQTCIYNRKAAGNRYMQHPYEQDEYHLYQDIKQGKPAAQRWLYAACYPMVVAVCLRYVGSLPDAEELVADSFIRFFDALKQSFQYKEQGSMKAYLKKIAVNQSLMFLRKQRLAFEEMEEQHEQLTDVNLDALDHLSAKDILKAVQQLPPGYRTVFNMYIIEGYSHAEIAETLQVSVATSKTQLMKAKLQLQKILSIYERYV